MRGLCRGLLCAVATACASLPLVHFGALYGLVAQKMGLSELFCDSLVGVIKCCCTRFHYFCLLLSTVVLLRFCSPLSCLNLFSSILKENWKQPRGGAVDFQNRNI